ncbi:type IVB secretion system protein IcmH/DotU [Thiocapsa roseopersicina]|uniref:Type VI secretion system protein ImpK n=1 Tax=Thiocapsa roseopersicina TaxID=1058 RepID=A0A1H2VT13_THIRO|nr:type IVB secretion system protein IcmH/DotU [Thiocapsa roseopersicina]SDW71009.1 type VI secretion system protein ImpK [Thiocapsa roseopersicina]
MTDDDPFSIPGDAGATVIRPIPGGRRSAAAPARPAAQPPPFSGVPPTWSAVGQTAPVVNPLVSCAAGLLTIAAELRGTVSHPDPAGLREGLVRQVREFETCARAKGLVDAVVLPARYVLCALIDESVLDTPWGTESVWSHQGLLISFHNETWGGEKFFSALERLLSYPSGNLNLLELMYLCLALGFEGRYRTRPDGRAQLDRVREQLFQTIRTQRGDPDPELSLHWQGAKVRRDPLIHQLPLWVFSAMAGLLLAGLFAFYSISLNRDSDPVFLSLSQLDRGLEVVVDRPRVPFAEPPPASPDAPAPLTLRILLAEEIAAGRLEVEDRPAGQTVIIRGDGLFASGSSSLTPGLMPLMRRIGEALARLPGTVLVTGHSDSVPIKTLRFPSNWHLSRERAERVMASLVEVVGDPSRFTAEGRADTEPRIPENPRDARNRRVEITLMGPRGGGSATSDVASVQP